MCKQNLGTDLSLLNIGSTAPASVKAELDLDTPSVDLDTIVRAKVAGDAGNDITVAAVADSVSGVTIVEDLTAKTVVIHYQDGVSTVANVETAITTDSDLIEVKTTGTGATVLDAADAFAATSLAGGTDPGIKLSSLHDGGMRPSKWLVTAVVTSAPSDLLMYGCVMTGGAIDTPADDAWGLHSHGHFNHSQGKIGTALAVGTHHIVVEDVGIYTRLFFAKSAGAIDVYLRAIHESDYGS